MSQEKAASVLQNVTYAAYGVAFLRGLLIPWFKGLVFSGVLVLLSVILGNDAKYRAHLSVTGYALLPSAFGNLIAGLFLARSESIDLAGKVALSAATFFPGQSGLVAGILRGLDPFELWTIYLLVMGFSVLSRRSPQRVMWLGALWFAGEAILLSLTGAT